jgi:hypothetical protein
LTHCPKVSYCALSFAEEMLWSACIVVERLPIDPDRKKWLTDKLKESKQYLKSDFKVHVSKSSLIADHCISYALSDPTSKEFRSECGHQHEEYCYECTTLWTILEEIKTWISTTSSKELIPRTLHKFQTAREAIEAWKSHQMRSVNQDLCREQVLNDLPSNGVYVNMDWAMKWEPAWYRESQNLFYGKRGISWHITVVIKRCNNSGDGDSANKNDDDDEGDVDNEMDEVVASIFLFGSNKNNFVTLGREKKSTKI